MSPPAKMTWDGRVNLGSILALVQLIGIMGGGFYFVGQFQEKILAVVQRMDGLEGTIQGIGTTLRIDTNRLNERIDRLQDRH